MPFSDPLNRVVGVQWGGKWVLIFTAAVTMKSTEAGRSADGSATLTCRNLTLSCGVGSGVGPGQLVRLNTTEFDINDFYTPEDLAEGPVSVFGTRSSHSTDDDGNETFTVDTIVVTYVLPTNDNSFLRTDLQIQMIEQTLATRDEDTLDNAFTTAFCEADHFTINSKDMNPTPRPNPKAFTVGDSNVGPSDLDTPRVTSAVFVIDTINHKIISEVTPTVTAVVMEVQFNMATRKRTSPAS